jgi:hypothetical protein
MSVSFLAMNTVVSTRVNRVEMNVHLPVEFFRWPLTA